MPSVAVSVGRFAAMIRKTVNALFLRLKYLRLLAEINILIHLTAMRRDQDFRRAKP
jgi:hypothetical protein